MKGRPIDSGERGQAMPLVAVGIVVLIGMLATAVDLGMLMTARTEAQRAADAAALAGAGSLIPNPANQDVARGVAIEYAARNEVHDAPADVREGDVTFPADERIQVVVRRTEERGNPVPTIFARILGFDAVDVSAEAEAEIVPARVVGCLLPVTIPDLWIDGPGGEDGVWEPEFDSYVPPSVKGSMNYEIGDQVVLKPAEGIGTTGGFEPGFWMLWHPAQRSGAANLDAYVTGCPEDAKPGIAPDTLLRDINGTHQSIVRAFREVIAAEPNLRWDAGCACVVDGSGDPFTGGSLRIRAVPLFDPSSYVKQGSGANFTVTAIAGVFVERVTTGPQGLQEVVGRLVGISGSGADPGGPGDAFAKTVRLVR